MQKQQKVQKNKKAKVRRKKAHKNKSTKVEKAQKYEEATWLGRESFRPECCSRAAVDKPSNTLSLGCNTWDYQK